MVSHITCLGDCQAVVEKLKHNYVRFTALQGQLFADLPSADGQPQQQSALKHFIGCTAQGQQYLDRLSQQRPFTNGKQLVSEPNAARGRASPPLCALLC